MEKSLHSLVFVIGHLWRTILVVCFLAVGICYAQTPSPSPSADAQAAGNTAEEAPPEFQSLRYEEDYSYLRGRSRCTSPLDRIKYIPLRGEAQPDWYLSIGGEVRLRYEQFRNDDWGGEPPDNNGYLLQRYMRVV